MKLFKRLLAAFGVLIVIGFLLFRPSYDEVARVTSPDGNYDAVLFESNGGATTSFSYDVYVVKKGQKSVAFESPVVTLYGAVRSNRAYGVNLSWSGLKTLKIVYKRAQETTLFSEYISIEGKLIQIKLESGIDDLNAPAGGMLYNKELNSK